MQPKARFLLAILCLLILAPTVHGQVHLDGPIVVMARLRSFNMTHTENDLAIFGASGQPDDMSYNIWGRDLPDVDTLSAFGGWGAGSGCLIEPYGVGQTPTDFNNVFFSQTYNSIQTPHAIEIRTDFWEDETPDQMLGIGCGGTRCTFDGLVCCGGFLFGSCLGSWESDDLRCNSNGNPGNAPYDTLMFRLGPPGQWYSHGNVGGNCANNIYLPTLETFWRTAGGESCSTPIFLGNLSPGFSPITNSNYVDGYTDDIPYVGGGLDVVYSFTVSQSMGLNISSCGAGTCPTDLVILNSSCTIVQTNSGACGNGSSIAMAFCGPGTYFVAVEGRNNATTGTFTLQISENPGLTLNASAGPDVPTCPGIPVVIGPGVPPSGGTPPYSYIWTPPTGLSSAIMLNPTAVGLASQQYVLTIADANGCVVTDTMQLTMGGGAPFSLGPDATVCSGSPSTLTGPSGGTSYLWSTGATTQSITTAIPGVYSLTVTSGGCQGADTLVLSLGSAVSPALGADTAMCPDTSIVLMATPGMSSYAWSTAGTTAAITVSAAGTYMVTVTDAFGCTAADTISVSIIPDCVFPGDVDHDGDCDLTDVLQLSVLNGMSGPARSLASTAWYGQPATDWTGSYMGVNDKHGDTDGDAVIGALDTTAIHLNYGQLHSRVGRVSSGAVVLRLVPQAPAVLAGNWARFDLYLEGAGGGTVDSVLGLAFRTAWDPTGMATFALRNADFSACWFAPPGNQLPFTHAMPLEVAFAVARNNGTMTSGSGLVGTISFLSNAALPAGQPFHFAPQMLQVEVIAADRSMRSCLALVDSILVTDTLTSLLPSALGLMHVYPNPASTLATVVLPADMDRLQVFSNQGMLLQDIALAGRRQLLLDLANLPNGIYLLRATGPGGVQVRKLQVRD